MGAHRRNGYNILVSLTVALGSLSYGYSISSLANALSKPVFNEYLNLSEKGPRANYTTSIIALWNCIIYVGSLFGCASYSLLASRLGRKKPIAIAAVLTIVGSALQAGSVDAAMLSVARLINGLGIGIILSGVPTYQAEIAPPSGRGLIVGLHASLIGFGTALASWIGVAFYHVHGSAGWRVPFALQCVPPLLLLTLIWTVPESPRWLYTNGQAEAAEQVLLKLHKNSADPDNLFAHNEMVLMKRQLDHEIAHRVSLTKALKRPSLRRRFMVGFLTMTGTQFGGLIVVLTYQSVIYSSLGYGPFLVQILGAVWTILNGISNFFGGVFSDNMPRVKQLIIGYCCVASVLTILCVLTELFGDSANQAGNSAAAAFTFILILVYGLGTECVSFVYTSELFPTEHRALGTSISILAVPFWSILFIAVASPAFANIGAKYYIVFIALTSLMVVIAYFLFPETRGYTLEQMAAVFGDEVVDMSPISLDHHIDEDKPTSAVELQEHATPAKH